MQPAVAHDVARNLVFVLETLYVEERCLSNPFSLNFLVRESFGWIRGMLTLVLGLQKQCPIPVPRRLLVRKKDGRACVTSAISH